MSLIIEQMQQQSPEWFKMRLGSIGGSGINIVASQGSGVKKYLYKKAAEIISGVHEESFKSHYLDRGNEYEEEAQLKYCSEYLVEPRIVGIVKHDDNKHYSPDFLIDKDQFGDRADGFAEIKVRIPSVFVEYADNGNIPTADSRQIQWGFRVTGRDWCDYINYCPEIAQAGTMSPMIVKRIYPDEEKIKSLDMACDKFIGQMAILIKKLKGGN